MNLPTFDVAANQAAATHHYLDAKESEDQATDAAITHHLGCEKIKCLMEFCEDFERIQRDVNQAYEPYKKSINEEDLQLINDACHLLGELTMPF